MEENYKNLPLLKFIVGCESANGNDIQVWINQEKEQLTYNDIVEPVSHASNNIKLCIFCVFKHDLMMLSIAKIIQHQT